MKNDPLDIACRKEALKAYGHQCLVKAAMATTTHCHDCGIRLVDADFAANRKRCGKCHESLNNVEQVEFDPREIVTPLESDGLRFERPSDGMSIAGAGDEDDEVLEADRRTGAWVGTVLVVSLAVFGGIVGGALVAVAERMAR